MPDLSLQQAFDLAVQHHQAGRLNEAEEIYRRILAGQPNHVEATHHLGILSHQLGRNNVAVDLIHRAITLRPDYPDAFNNLGIALKGQGRIDEAIAAFRQAIALKPDYAQACSNLGESLRLKCQLDAAIAACQQAIALAPNFPQAHLNLGNALKDHGQIHQAIAAFRQAVFYNANYAEAHNNLGNCLRELGRLTEAVGTYRQAISLKPDYAEAYGNLGNALRDNGQLDEAIAAYQKSISLKPNLAATYVSLGNALRIYVRLDEAIAAHRRAIALTPDCADAHSNLGNALRDNGQLEEAIAAYRRAIALDPDNSYFGSNLVFALWYDPAQTAQSIVEEHRRWNRQYAEPLGKFIPPHSNDRDPDRPLRIGYVSPDFREHIVARNVLPLFLRRDRRKFEITAYAQVLRPDATTRQIQQATDRWRSIAGLSDEQVAAQIRDDGIDILVDLALHTAGNRLLVFARKPAPVQVSFAGYPATTGLTAIDYRLSDPFLDPPDASESLYGEQVVRLPDSFWCFQPTEGHDISVNPLPTLSLSNGPALEKGVITFGCLGNFAKINAAVLSRWSHVMRQVENSRLLLLAPEGSYRARTLDCFGRHGIVPERIEFSPPLPLRRYLQLYHRIDICLDTFPYNGHTTSLDSFWMGVPVITLVGKTPVARAGWCQLSNLGLEELAAQTPDQFVEIALKLAHDLPRLKGLRATLRDRMRRSPLMDAPRFAENIEAAYRRMWRTWCERT